MANYWPRDQDRVALADAHGTGDRLVVGSGRPAWFEHDDPVRGLQVERGASGVDLQDRGFDAAVLNPRDHGVPFGGGGAAVDASDRDVLLAKKRLQAISGH